MCWGRLFELSSLGFLTFKMEIITCWPSVQQLAFQLYSALPTQETYLWHRFLSLMWAACRLVSANGRHWGEIKSNRKRGSFFYFWLWKWEQQDSNTCYGGPRRVIMGCCKNGGAHHNSSVGMMVGNDDCKTMAGMSVSDFSGHTAEREYKLRALISQLKFWSQNQRASVMALKESLIFSATGWI